MLSFVDKHSLDLSLLDTVDDLRKASVSNEIHSAALGTIRAMVAGDVGGRTYNDRQEQEN